MLIFTRFLKREDKYVLPNDEAYIDPPLVIGEDNIFWALRIRVWARCGVVEYYGHTGSLHDEKVAAYTWSRGTVNVGIHL